MLFPFPGVPQQPQECEELGNSYQTEREESEISELFAIGRHQMNRCLKCNKEVPFQGLHYAIIIMSSYSRKPHLAISAATISLVFSSGGTRIGRPSLRSPVPSTEYNKGHSGRTEGWLRSTPPGFSLLQEKYAGMV